MLKKLKTWTSKIRPEIKYILLLFIVSRILLAVIGVSSQILMDPYHGALYVWHYSTHRALDIWGVWDTGWYLSIAHNWYSTFVNSTGPTAGQANYAFFPLYPALIKVLEKIIGDYFISGLIISNIALLFACIFLYALVKVETDDQTAWRSVKYMFLFPTAFILSGAFTESLFLMLLLMCFYYAKKSRWAYVAVAGYFLSLSRFLGVFALLPLLYVYLQSINFNLKKIRPNILYLVALPLGLATFMVYNYHLTGDFMAFAHAQTAWYREVANPFKILFDGLVSKDIYAVYQAGPALAAILFLLAFCKKIGPAYTLLGIYSIFIPLSTGLLCMTRYLLVVFPFYIIFAKLTKNQTADQFFTIILALLQGFFMVFWANGFRLVI